MHFYCHPSSSVNPDQQKPRSNYGIVIHTIHHGPDSVMPCLSFLSSSRALKSINTLAPS